MTRIAFLGLGAMGGRMAARLLGAGHELTVWNRSAAAAAPLLAAGARQAASPRAAADGAEVVWSMVYDDAASRTIWLDPASGALAAMPRDALAIESSTLTPRWLHELAGVSLERGIAFVDAPVAGSRPQAEAGQLVFMAGGDAAAVARARPLFGVLGGAVHHVGAGGAGAWLKLAVNALFAAQVAAVGEQLAVLRRAGIDPQRALEALRAMPVLSPAAAGAGALMLAGNYAPQAPVDLIAKDLGYAIAEARRVGGAIPLAEAVKERFIAAQTAGLGGENVVAVAKLYR